MNYNILGTARAAKLKPDTPRRQFPCKVSGFNSAGEFGLWHINAYNAEGPIDVLNKILSSGCSDGNCVHNFQEIFTAWYMG